jgi:segregation and condensation protein B
MPDGIRNSVVEALILASPEPLAAGKIAEVVDDLTPSRISQAVAELNGRYMESGSAYRIRELAGGYQFYIVPEFTGYIEELFTRRRKLRLTRAALETLAIVAYRQPATRTEIEHIRGVASDGVLHNLLEKNLIVIKGRAATVGKPLQYGTTDEFLKFFGLNSLEDLPKMSEIEELIATRQPRDQTELELEEGRMAVKLNVADGTYRPGPDDEDDDVRDDPVAKELSIPAPADELVSEAFEADGEAG